LLADRLDRFAAIDAEQCKKARDRYTDSLPGFAGWAGTWFGQQEKKVTDALSPIFAAIFAVSNKSGAPEAAAAFAQSYCASARDVALATSSGPPPFDLLRDSMLDQVFNDS
jgi:hypothetical protein